MHTTRSCLRIDRVICLLTLVVAAPGCVVFETLEGVQLTTEPETGKDYFLYVPTTYDSAQAWPLIVTCHGTHPFDTAERQIKEWKALAETKRFIVAAPKLSATRGDFPPPPDRQIERQRQDEKLILRLINHIRGSRNIAEDRIFLTGWSAGGYAVLFTGLRNPDVFRALSARQANFDERYLTPVVPDLDPYQPIQIHYGNADILVRDQCRASVEWLLSHNMFVQEQITTGGHQRRQEETYRFFLQCIREYPWLRVNAYTDDSGDRPRTVRFVSRASESVRRYAWDFGDGNKSPVAAPEHTYAADGAYRVQLTAELEQSGAQTRTISLTIPFGSRPTSTAPANSLAPTEKPPTQSERTSNPDN